MVEQLLPLFNPVSTYAEYTTRPKQEETLWEFNFRREFWPGRRYAGPLMDVVLSFQEEANKLLTKRFGLF